MRYIALCAFLLLTFGATAQTTILDTSYQVSNNGIFYDVHRFEYSDGSYSERAIAIGDTSALMAYHSNQFNAQARDIRGYAVKTLDADRILNQMINLDQQLFTAYKISPIVSYQFLLDSFLTNTSWQLEDLSGNVINTLAFSRNATGKLRVQYGTDTRIVHLFEGVMRIPNFPSSTPSNFYQVNSNLWVTADRRLFIRRVGTARR